MVAEEGMKKGYKRFQCDLSGEAWARLEFIIAKTGMASNAETVRRALKIYAFLVDWASVGYDVEIKKDDHAIVIPRELL